MQPSPAEVTPLAESPSGDSSAPESLPSTQDHRPTRPGRRRFAWILALAIVAAVALVALLLRSRTSPPTQSSYKVAPPLERILRLKGTTEAVESRAILAPLISGQQVGTLTIVHLTAAGTRVKEGDVLVEFDRQSQMKDYVDKQADYQKLVNQVAEEQAKEIAAKAKDETELKQAEHNLGKAELEIQKTEIISRIDAEKDQENLDEAKATYDQLREAFDLKRKAAQAAIRVLEIQRDRTQQIMMHARANADLMQVHSPLDGVVVLNTIWKQGTMGEVQEGDQVRPGVTFMQVVNPSVMQVRVLANQQDFPALRVGETVKVRLDAYPELVVPRKAGADGSHCSGQRLLQQASHFHCDLFLAGERSETDAGPLGRGGRRCLGTECGIRDQRRQRERIVMIERFRRFSLRGKALAITAILLAGSGVLLGAARFARRGPNLPTIEVSRGEFLDSLQFRGEMKAMKSLTISAPSEAGDLQIIKIAPEGTVVKSGDLVVQFDGTKLQQQLAQFRSALKSAEAEVGTGQGAGPAGGGGRQNRCAQSALRSGRRQA